MQDFYQAGFKLILMSSFYLCMKEIIKEVTQREKQEEIIPDPDVDAYMKVPYSIHKTSSHVYIASHHAFTTSAKPKYYAEITYWTLMWLNKFVSFICKSTVYPVASFFSLKE